MSVEQAHNFKTTFRNRTLSYLVRVNRKRPPGSRRAPEKVVLDVAPGVTASPKPPVRIYVGTESAQFRAERVFVWSILQQRDPARVYEIYLMKDLAGFNRHGWKTGFTCYRYAIPTFAGGTGRAIYNDVDQIYLSDPAELFDMEMGGKGVLGINARETSVMLLDCERMIRIWHYADALKGEKHKGFRAAMHDAKLWGVLPGVWNARDGEYVAGQSKVLHFTTLQTQPWRPFPNDLRYEEHPLSELWHDLERAADAARFTVFTRSRPSQHFADIAPLAHSENGANGRRVSRRHIEPVASLIRETGAQTVLAYGSNAPALHPPDTWGSTNVTCADDVAAPIDGTFDGVVCVDLLEQVPDDDVPWMLDELFSRARCFVYVGCASGSARQRARRSQPALVTPQSAHWWREQMAAADRRHPGLKWVLNTGASPARDRWWGR